MSKAKQLLTNYEVVEREAREQMDAHVEKQIAESEQNPFDFTEVHDISAMILRTEDRESEDGYYCIIASGYLAVETDKGDFLVKITGDLNKAAFYAFNEFAMPSITLDAAQALYKALLKLNPEEICEYHGFLTGFQIKVGMLSEEKLYDEDIYIDYSEEYSRVFSK